MLLDLRLTQCALPVYAVVSRARIPRCARTDMHSYGTIRSAAVLGAHVCVQGAMVMGNGEVYAIGKHNGRLPDRPVAAERLVLAAESAANIAPERMCLRMLRTPMRSLPGQCTRW